MLGCRIRVEEPPDHEAIGAVVEEAFGSRAEARLVEAIRVSAESIPDLSLVAELDPGIIGHVMVSYATLVDGDVQRRIAMLSPLAVKPAQQRQGVGSALVREVTARADRRGEPLVILEGSPVFYPRLGFEPADRYGIRIPLPSWAPPEAAQVLRLAAYDPAWRGQVVYPPAFEQVQQR